HFRHQQRHVHADRRDRLDPAEFRADQRLGLPDGAGRVRVPAHPRRLRVLPEVHRARGVWGGSPMKRRALFLLAVLALLSCAPKSNVTTITVQRFFGECGAQYGAVNQASRADGECGIMTALVNQFNAENPDIRVNVNIVPWPGYDQLSAQLASGDPPDLVTMHQSAIPDYQMRHLLLPLHDALVHAGVDPARFTPAARNGVSKA